MARSRRRIVEVKVLPGEPTDGSGRVCIHLFVPDPVGQIVEPHVLHPAPTPQQPNALEARATRGHLACDPRKPVAPVARGNVVVVTMRSDDPRAVTCHACITSALYQEAMARLEAPSEAT